MIQKLPKSTTLLSSLIALSWLSISAEAALTITFEQVGDDMVVRGSGYLDVTSLTPAFSKGTNNPGQIASNLPQDLVRRLATYAGYSISTGTDFFSNTFSAATPSSESGVTFGIWADSGQTTLYVPEDFTFGNISGSMTFSDFNVSSLGVVGQVIDFGSSEDQRLIIEKPSSVPEPSSAALVVIGLLGVVARRRR